MLRFVLQRLFHAVAVLFTVVAVSFAVMRAAPGSPFDTEQPLPPAVVANQARVLGMAEPVVASAEGRLASVSVGPGQSVGAGQIYALLDGGVPLRAPEDLTVFRVVAAPGATVGDGAPVLFKRTGFVEELFTTVGSWARLDFGVTVRSQGTRTVAQNLAEGLPVSAELGLYGLVVALLLALPLGVAAGARPGSVWDRAVSAGLLFGISVPSLVLAPVLVAVFIMGLEWFPPHGGWEPGLFHGMSKKALPVLALALPYAAVFGRLVRDGLAAQVNEDWFRHLAAKGLPLRVALIRHALRPALVPLVTYLGPALASLLTGSFVVERVFQIPGISRHFVDSALERDYPMVLGVVMVYSAVLVVANLAADLLHAWLDPRVRAESA